MVRSLRLVVAFGLMAFAFVATGCDQVKGGGWIPSPVPGEKASFGLTARCVENADPVFPPELSTYALYEGNLEWFDRGANVRFHADVEPVQPLAIVAGASCEETITALTETGHELLTTAELTGEYRPQPPGLPGRFVLQVVDNGEPGIDRDTVTIELIGGQYNGYTNTGTIQGGNIQVD